MLNLYFCPICNPNEAKKYKSVSDVREINTAMYDSQFLNNGGNVLIQVHCGECGEYKVGVQALTDVYDEHGFPEHGVDGLPNKRFENNKKALRGYVKEHGVLDFAGIHSEQKKYGYVPKQLASVL